MQHADHTTAFVIKLNSLSQLLNLLDDFKGVSGLEVNKYKTEAMQLVSWRDCYEQPFGFVRPQGSIVNWLHDPNW